MKKKVYLDAGSLEQYQKVVDEYRNSVDGNEVEFVYLMNADQIVEPKAEIWRCRELDRSLQEMYECGFEDVILEGM